MSRWSLPLLAAALSCGGGSKDEVPAEPAPKTEPATTSQRPNVLIVLWDTVRADHLSLYGHDRATTPKLDAWAQGATVYRNAWSPGTWTVPAHGSLFTGLPIATHGAHGDHPWLDDGHRTLAEILADDGYDTFAMSANLYVGSVANMLQGFETVHTTYPRKELRRGRYVAESLAATEAKVLPSDGSTEISPMFGGSRAEKWDKSVYKDAAPIIAGGLVDFLDERQGDAPWFAYLNFMEAHTPRLPSQASRKALLTPAEQTQALNTDMSLFAENSWMVGQKEYTEAELGAFADVYDAALRDLDDATATLFAELERRGVLEDTVVILVSDHGESLGEHRRLEHRWTIHEPLLHVPLVVRYPKRGFGPRTVSTPVSTIDLFDTVIELTGADRPSTVGLYSHTLTDEADRGPIFGELVHAYAGQLRPIHRAYPQLDLSEWKRTFGAVRDGPLKLVDPSDGPSELYDLQQDPGETVDLATHRPHEVKRLEGLLSTWVSERAPYVPGGNQERELSAEERAQLEILGYLPSEDDGKDDDGSGE